MLKLKVTSNGSRKDDGILEICNVDISGRSGSFVATGTGMTV